MRRTGLLWLLPAAAAAVLAGCSATTTSTTTTSAPTTSAPSTTASSVAPGSSGLSGGTTTSGTAAAGSAPCTNAALLDGVTAQDASVTEITLFRCDGQWAYAQTSNSTGAFLLEANGPRWSVVPATAATCQGSTVPSAIRSVACVAG
jgi:hypothetical protein